MSSRTRFRLSLTACLVFLATASVATAQYSGGRGTADDPYQIASAADLMLLGESPGDHDKDFVLTADIDLDPILPGRKVFERAVIDSFRGGFDGNGHVISHLTIQGDGDLGLFRRLLDGASVSNLGMEAVSIDGTGDYVAGLVGYNQMGSITMSYTTGTIKGDEYVGGLVGENAEGGSIISSYSAATVLGNRDVGGLVGANYGSVTACLSAGAVSGMNRHVGGLVGANDGVIAATYSTAAVSGLSSVGGLVGVIGERENTSITMSYSTGSVSGGDAVGGLVGENAGSIVSGFWNVETSGLANSEGGTGKTTAEMRIADTFLDAGWGCPSPGTWTIDEGNDYPRLWWEEQTGEPISVGIHLSDYLVGMGTTDDPYLISTAEELNLIGLAECHWDKHFRLIASVDLSEYAGTRFNRIGTEGTPFSGVFDGSGHTISNFSFASEDASHVGVFGYVDGSEAEIRDLGLIWPSVDVEAGRYVGSLVGRLERGLVRNCCVKGGTVSGHEEVAGLAGSNSGIIMDCYANTSVGGTAVVGGLVANNKGTIMNCYSAGPVSGSAPVGSFVAVNEGTVSVCFFDRETSWNFRAGANGPIGVRTAWMQTGELFIASGWDFVDESENGTEDVWWILEGQDYPRLWWEPLEDWQADSAEN